MIFESLIIFLIIYLLILAVRKIWQNRHPDVGLNAKQLIERYGYSFESHTVQTEDGYLLELHRIPPIDKKNMYNRPPVLIMPGLWCSSADWVNMGENSLGFILSKEGYDVWLGNYRGTTWSKKHTNLDCKKDKKKFFDYSFQEIGCYDFPAFVDYILNVTKQKDLIYIGHSLGTMIYFVLMSDKPNYNEKIRLAIAMSPSVTSVKKPKSPIFRFLLKTQHSIEFIVKKTDYYEIMPHSKYLAMFTQIFCHKFSPFKYGCLFVFHLVGGFSTQLDTAKIPIIVSNAPAGTSYKLLKHCFQLQNRPFGKYDYGKVKNIKKYGQPTPPEYDLSKSIAPMAVFYGSKDAIVSPKNVQYLISKLPNVIIEKIILDFNHLDILWGNDAEEFIFRDIVKIINSYSLNYKQQNNGLHKMVCTS